MVNPLRGEAKIVIAGTTYVLAATMDDMTALSVSVGDPPFRDLYTKLLSSALGVQAAALAALIQGGTTADGKSLKRKDAVAAALRDRALTDLTAWAEAMVELLKPLTRDPGDDTKPDDEGNATAASP